PFAVMGDGTTACATCGAGTFRLEATDDGALGSVRCSVCGEAATAKVLPASPEAWLLVGPGGQVTAASTWADLQKAASRTRGASSASALLDTTPASASATASLVLADPSPSEDELPAAAPAAGDEETAADKADKT